MSAPALPPEVLAALAGKGQIVAFDRSWYGRVLVERVEGLAARRNGGAPIARSMNLSAC